MKKIETEMLEKKAIKYILIAVLMLVVVLCIAISASGQKTGYLLVVDYADGKTKAHRTESIAFVEKSFYNHFKQSYDLEKELKTNVFVQHRNNHIVFYVEKKRIVTNRKGKEKYKTIKKSKRR